MTTETVQPSTPTVTIEVKNAAMLDDVVAEIRSEHAYPGILDSRALYAMFWVANSHDLWCLRVGDGEPQWLGIQPFTLADPDGDTSDYIGGGTKLWVGLPGVTLTLHPEELLGSSTDDLHSLFGAFAAFLNDKTREALTAATGLITPTAAN